MATSDLMTQSVGEQHTVFLPPDAFSRFRASLTSDSGRVGLGILIQGQTAPFTISSVIAGAPAEQAGVQEGDVILAIDGRTSQRLGAPRRLGRAARRRRPGGHPDAARTALAPTPRPSPGARSPAARRPGTATPWTFAWCGHASPSRR